MKESEKPTNILVRAQKEAESVGRPISYNPAYCELAYKLCLLGSTDVEMADIFKISEANLNNWKNNYPEFLESINKGKFTADAEVANKLFHRATGYEHPEIDIKMYMGEIITTELVKHYPPDTAAAIFWLKNRSKKWKDKQDVDVTSGGEKIQSIAPYNFVKTSNPETNQE